MAAGPDEAMQASVDRVLVIFPFEERIYKDAGVDVRFVGHPLVDAAKAGQSRAEFLAAHGLAPDAPTIACCRAAAATKSSTLRRCSRTRCR